MTINVLSNLDDQINLQSYLQRRITFRSKSFIGYVYVLPAIFLVVNIFYITDIFLKTTNFFLCSIFFFFYFKNIFSNNYKMIKKQMLSSFPNCDRQLSVEYKFEENEIIVKRIGITQNIDYSEIEELINTKNYIFLIFINGYGIVIPVSNLEDQIVNNITSTINNGINKSKSRNLTTAST